MFGREPAVIIAALTAFIGGGAIFYLGDVSASASSVWWAAPVLAIIQGILTRQTVVPVETVKDAGYTPDEIKARAKNPAVQRVS